LRNARLFVPLVQKTHDDCHCSALTVSLLAAVESLLSAVVADGMSGTKHNSNVELLAQGVANFASPLFGGIPATGAIARTATNIRAGARTPVAGVIYAITLPNFLPLEISAVACSPSFSLSAGAFFLSGMEMRIALPSSLSVSCGPLTFTERI
jgi:sulfate permease, SulP family